MTSATSPEQWGADRNGLVKQSLIGEHMVRITLETVSRDATPEELEVYQRTRPGRMLKIRTHLHYRVTIGMFWKHGRDDPRYNEFMCRRTFELAPLAWQYGVRLAKGATMQARNN